MAESSGGEDLTLQHVVVLGILFNMMMFHVRLAKPDILSALNVLRTWAQNQEVSRREKQQQLRVEEQMCPVLHQVHPRLQHCPTLLNC